MFDTGERSLERGKGAAVDSPKLADGNEANETFQRRRLTEEVTSHFWQPLESEVGGLGAIYLLLFFATILIQVCFAYIVFSQITPFFLNGFNFVG